MSAVIASKPGNRNCKRSSVQYNYAQHTIIQYGDETITVSDTNTDAVRIKIDATADHRLGTNKLMLNNENTTKMNLTSNQRNNKQHSGEAQYLSPDLGETCGWFGYFHTSFEICDRKNQQTQCK